MLLTYILALYVCTCKDKMINFLVLSFIVFSTVQGATTPCCCSSSNPIGPLYYIKLGAVKDVWLEGTTNKNYHGFLIFGKHPQYPKKRILIQFQDLPKTCKNVTIAKLHFIIGSLSKLVGRPMPKHQTYHVQFKYTKSRNPGVKLQLLPLREMLPIIGANHIWL